MDQEIADKRSNGTAHDYVNITVLLNAAPTTQDAAVFVSSGGYLTTPPWTKATYGFGGMIPYETIALFTQQCSNVLLVDKEAVGKVTLAYATQQVGARTYVWNTLGLQGDTNASTAILDTGIDASHVDFLSGYGNQDFSKKIVGWSDLVNSTMSPFDDNGHGTHVAGLAAGAGFFSVDASGYATTTWGTDLTLPWGSSGYSYSGMMVNSTGNITLSVKWLSTGSARITGLSLYKSGKNLYTFTKESSRDTPSRDKWYSLAFNVQSIPLGGYDIYNPRVDIAGGTGTIYVVLNASWPYAPPSDGFSAWTGIAPQSKLVGVKILDSTGSGTSTDFITGIEWIIENRMTYHITAASMSISFGSEVPDADLAVLNLVNSGVTVVVSSGNSGAGGNYIFSSGSVDEVITVAAMNQFDSIADYSSQGGPSRYTGNTVKPDITAPGGSHYGVPLFSADSNYEDTDGWFLDVQANDSAPLLGTSMAAPIISGCAQIVIQAMGGYANWNWTRNQALQPKMILLMTATETYPNIRETGNSSTSPTLNRGEKDVHEGYGRVNLDAAVDAVISSYTLGSVVTDTLGMPPTPTDISVLGQRLAWARNVQLIAGQNYSFSLSIPAGADYDLYCYNSTGTAHGEPAIVAKSINATNGGIEQFWVTAPYTGTYYLVVKRATETTESGAFTLSSHSANTVNVIFNTPGMPNASNVVHYIQNGVSKTGDISANMFSDYMDIGTTVTIDNPVYVSSTQRYVTTDTVSFTIQSNATLTVTYKTQYHLAVDSSQGMPIASQWIDQGDSFTVSVTSPTETVIRDQQWLCTGYSIDGGSASPGTSYTFTNVQATHTIMFNWKQQFWIQVTSAHGAPTISAWVDQGEDFTAAVSSPAEFHANTSKLLCTGYSIDGGSTAAGTSHTFNNVEDAHTVDFNWKRQFYLAVNSTYGSPSGDGWHDEGATVTAVLTSGTIPDGSGVQYAFTGWKDAASGTGLTSDEIVMDEAKTATANWKTQYYLITSTAYGAASGTGWYDSGLSAFAGVSTSTVTETEGTQHIFVSWSGDASGIASPSNAITMNGPKTATANWKTQYYLSISTNFGSVTPSNGWYDAGVTVDISTSGPSAGEGERYVWNRWTGTGTGNYTGTSKSAQVTLDSPVAEVASWTQQYMLTVTSPHGTPTPLSEWFDSGTSITASVNSPVTSAVVTQYICKGWTGSGSVPAAGAATRLQFMIDQPSSIIWNWETQFLSLPLIIIVVVIVSVVLTVIAVYLLLRRRHNSAV